jgi:hypothetical protein
MSPIRSFILTATLLLCAGPTHGTVGESAVFSIDTRDDFTQLAAESGVFAFDTRSADGLSSDGNSGPFTLDTRNFRLTNLQITGPAAPGIDQAEQYHCWATYSDGATREVTSDANWALSGPAAVSDSVISHGQLSLSASDTRQPLTIHASYQTAYGQRGAVLTINPMPALTVTVSQATTLLAGNYYQVSLSASASGGVPPITYQWDLNASGVYASPGAANQAVYLTSNGGRTIYKVKATDAEGHIFTRNVSVVINKPPVPNQPGKLAPVSGADGAVFCDLNGNPFQFDPARANNGLIVLTHGLRANGQEDWIKGMAGEIEARIPAAQRPNVLVYDWGNASTPTGFSFSLGAGLSTKALTYAATKAGWLTKGAPAVASIALATKNCAGFEPYQTHCKGVRASAWQSLDPRSCGKPTPYRFLETCAFCRAQCGWIRGG